MGRRLKLSSENVYNISKLGGKIMNKADLILKISEKLDVSRFDVEEIVDEFLTMIEKEIVKVEDVKLSGFGIFEKKIRKERKGTNPSDGAIITIPSKATIAFRPSKNFKAKVN